MVLVAASNCIQIKKSEFILLYLFVKTFFLNLWKKISAKKGSSQPLISSALDLAIIRSVRKQTYPYLSQVKHFKRFLNKRERRLYQFGLLGLCIGVIWFGVSFYTHNTTVVAARGGEYIEGMVGAPALINPLFASLNDVDKDIARLLYSGLMKVDESGNLVTDLAENFSLSDDKKTYTFLLKKNVVWHDGEAFTSKDIVFTFDSIQNKSVNSPLAVSFQGIKVTAIDDYTVQFTLPEVYTPFPSSLTLGILPEHVWSDIPVEQIRLARINLKPVGTGPFEFSRLVSDKSGYISEYSLKRFDRYYQRPAYLDTITFRFFASYDGDDPTNAAIEALREQNIDGVNFVPISLKDKADRKHTVFYTPLLPQYTALFFNEKKQPVLAEKDVRLALSEAIDKQKIIKDTQKGDALAIFGPILAGYPGYATSVTGTVSYSLDAANARLDKYFVRVNADEYKERRKGELEKEWLLENAPATGTSSTVPTTATSSLEMKQFVENTLKDEFTGAQTFFRKTKKGTDIVSLHLLTVDTVEYHKAAELIAAFWQEVGIQTTVEYVSSKSLSRDILKDRKYDVLLYGVLLGSDPDQYPFWHSSQASYPGLNLSQYNNKTVDSILEKTRATDKAEDLATLYRQFEDKILQDIPAVFLYSPQYHYAVEDKIKGIQVTRITEPSDRLSGAVNWYVKIKRTWGTTK